MITNLNIPVTVPLILQTTDIVYGQRPYWSNTGIQHLKLSLLRPRFHFGYDSQKDIRPLVIWLCGGGWTEVDHNIWLPQLLHLAEQGYVVASVGYSLAPNRFFPEQLKDIKRAIRYLRAHADEYGIDPERVAVMGESAGGHLAAMAAVTGNLPQFRTPDDSGFSDAVKCAVPYYPCVDMMDYDGRSDPDSYETRHQVLMKGEFTPQGLLGGIARPWADERAAAMDPRSYIGPDTPPFLILHGTADSIVPIHHSEALYQALGEAGVSARFLRVTGADHADWRFYQPEVKRQVLEFLKENL